MIATCPERREHPVGGACYHVRNRGNAQGKKGKKGQKGDILVFWVVPRAAAGAEGGFQAQPNGRAPGPSAVSPRAFHEGHSVVRPPTRRR